MLCLSFYHSKTTYSLTCRQHWLNCFADVSAARTIFLCVLVYLIILCLSLSAYQSATGCW